MSNPTKDATFVLDGRPGVEYETTITETSSGDWKLTDVRIVSPGAWSTGIYSPASKD